MEHEALACARCGGDSGPERLCRACERAEQCDEEGHQWWADSWDHHATDACGRRLASVNYVCVQCGASETRIEDR